AAAPASVDPQVTADRPARLLQPLSKRRDAGLRVRFVRRGVHQHADTAYALALLRPRQDRPADGCRAAEQRDEVAALHLRGHSITSSARASRAVSADFCVATSSASIFIFLYLGSDVTSAPIQSGSANSWPASASSISANTTPSRSPS